MSYQDIIDALDGKIVGITPEMRQEAYMEARISGKTGAQAAKEAGYGVGVRRTPRKLIETPELKARMQQSLIRQRVTLDTLAGRVSDALGANVVETTKEGAEETDIPDHKARLKAVEIGARLWGLSESERGATVAVQINFPAGLAEMFGADAKEFEGK